MNIVLEGPDGSGKSTLAQYIGQSLGWSIVQSEGPERYPGEINERISRYLVMDGVIFDRHPCISQSIYSAFNGTTVPDASLMYRFFQSRPLMIWCAAQDLSNHKPREEVDSPDHLRMLENFSAAIIHAYEQWALSMANIHYRIGDDCREIVAMIKGVVDVRSAR